MSLQIRTLPFASHESVSTTIIHEVPAEILSEIFIACLPDDEFILPSSHKAPMLISQVCGRWRGVSMSTPKLWCSMKFVIQQRDAKVKTALFNAWLERSGNHPLQLSISFWQFHHHDAIDAIIRVSHRLENISFFLPASSWRSLNRLKGNVSRLRRISVNTSNSETFRKGPFNGFSEAPELNEVALGFWVAGIDLPWSQISRAIIRSQDAHQCLGALHRATKIDECTFVRCDPFTLRPHYFAPVTLSLRSLRIIEETGTCNFLNTFTLPAVREISFSFTSWTTWPHTEFLELLKRSSCALEKLVLSDVAMVHSELIECLQILPSLVELHIEAAGSWLNDIILECLTRKGDEQPLIPNLRVLNLGGAFGFDDHVFADMVESRWRVERPSNVACLKSIYLEYHRMPNMGALERLQFFHDQGLDVDIVHADDSKSLLIMWPLW